MTRATKISSAKRATSKKAGVKVARTASTRSTKKSDAYEFGLKIASEHTKAMELAKRLS